MQQSEKIKAFIEAVNEDKEMREALKNSIATMAEAEKNRVQEMESKVLGQIVQIANEKGFDFSAQDMKTFFQQQIQPTQNDGQLNMEQLDQVSGGGNGLAIFVSIGTLSLGCGIISIAGAVLGSCKGGFDHLDNNVSPW